MSKPAYFITIYFNIPENNRIDFDGIYKLTLALKENTTLTSLNLSENALNDESAFEIATLLKERQILSALYLSSNDLTDIGAAFLASSLKVNTSLHTMDLEYNKFGKSKDGEDKSLLLEAIQINQRITTLEVDANPFKKCFGKELAISLQRNQQRLVSFYFDQAYDFRHCTALQMCDFPGLCKWIKSYCRETKRTKLSK
eukprot:Awhi_evm1s11212